MHAFLHDAWQLEKPSQHFGTYCVVEKATQPISKLPRRMIF
jgi:hypothetical protein